MAFIVPGVCRYTINQTLEAHNVVNVIDFEIDTTGSTMSRATAVFNQAGELLNQWNGHIRTLQVDDLVCQSVSWVDLDDEDGTTGSRIHTADADWPNPGSNSDNPEPSGLAVLVKKQLEGSSRARRNGRLYWCGVATAQKDDADANNIKASYLTTFQDHWDGFFNDVQNIGADPEGYQSHICVVHILTRDEDGVPLTGDHTNVDSLVVDPAFAYQRRRAGR